MSATSEPTASQTTAEPAPAEPASASPLDRHASPVAETSQRSGAAVASMVLGILGVAGAFLLPAVGLILGIIAIVFGRQAKADVARTGKSGRAQAQAGFVLGIIAVVGSIINMIVTAAIIAS
jgi:hypothetical protein